MDHGETGFVLEPPEAIQERKTEKEPENNSGGNCNSAEYLERVQGNSWKQSPLAPLALLHEGPVLQSGVTGS